MNEEENLLNDLIENGFDFLEEGIAQFKDKQKYSIINFYSGIEILLKARLFAENPALILRTNKPVHQPDIEKFTTGDFSSIPFNQLISKIKGKKIFSQKAFEDFEKLAQHRNRMVHFFHHEISPKSKKETTNEIVREQWRCWSHLRKLLEKWSDKLDSTKLEKIHNKMHLHEEYLDHLFEELQPEIEKAKSNGVIFSNCRNCKKEALKYSPLNKYIINRKCQVCLQEDPIMRIPCNKEGCNGTIERSTEDDLEDGYYYCNSCDEPMQAGEILEILDPQHHSRRDYKDPPEKISCSFCHYTGAVLDKGDHHFCANCFCSTTKNIVIGECNWCGAQIMTTEEDLNHSHLTGYEFCEGMLGHMKYRDD